MDNEKCHDLLIALKIPSKLFFKIRNTFNLNSQKLSTYLNLQLLDYL